MAQQQQSRKRRRPISGAQVDLINQQRRASNAAAAASAADAKRLDAQRAATEAATRDAQTRAQIAKAERDGSVEMRAFRLATATALPVAGMVLGHKMAKSIEARHVAALKARDANLKALAKSVANPKAAGNAGLKAAASTAKRLGLTNLHGHGRFIAGAGRLGLARAALLLAEGAFSATYLADKARATGNESAAEVFQAVGTGSIAAASTLVGERGIHLATSKMLPAATDVAKIGTAKIFQDAKKLPGAPKSAAKNIARRVAVRAIVQGTAKKAAESGTAAVAAKNAARASGVKSAISAASAVGKTLARGGGGVKALGLLIAGGAALAATITSRPAQAAPIVPVTAPLARSWLRRGRVQHRSTPTLNRLLAARRGRP